jgi:hypothetical protein
VTEEHVGGWRWHSTGGWPRQLKEEADSVLRWLLAVDGGSVAGLAWRRGTRGRCGVVGASSKGVRRRGSRGARQEQSGPCTEQNADVASVYMIKLYNICFITAIMLDLYGD